MEQDLSNALSDNNNLHILSIQLRCTDGRMVAADDLKTGSEEPANLQLGFTVSIAIHLHVSTIYLFQ